MTPQLNPPAARPTANPSAQAMDLAHAMRREAAVVRELRDALVQQRAGVGGSDATVVNDTVDAIERILLTLGEARTRRTALAERMALQSRPSPEVTASALSAVEAARLELRQAAEQVSRETAINKAVLRRAVENGEAFLQALFSSVGEPSAVYAPPERPAEPAGSGVLLNRKA